MSAYRRISKEEYYLFGGIKVWTIGDATKLLASFELECSGEFGESPKLISFDRNNMFFFGEPIEIESKYKNIYVKWENLLFEAIKGHKLPSCNVPCCNEDLEYAPPVGAGKQIDLTYCSFRCNDLLNYINQLVKSGNLQFNLSEFINALKGDSKAPEASKTVEIPMPPSDYLRRNAKKRHEPDKHKHESLETYLEDDLSGTCTCTVSQARERIFRDKYRNDKKYLKAETGYSKIMFDREVTKALLKIQKLHGGINRLNKTEGFIAKKVPACIKHPQK